MGIFNCLAKVAKTIALSVQPVQYPLSHISFAFLLNLYSYTQKKVKYPALVEKIYQTLLDKNVSVAQLAKELGYSPIYLERYFKSYTGSTISNYVLKRKLQEAQNLILTTNHSIKEIAEKLGYSNAKGLICLFKNQLNITPLEFKKQHNK